MVRQDDLPRRLKGWRLLDIVDSQFANCEYCGAHIRWGFLLGYGSERKVVGSECVKSHLDTLSDPQTALAFLQTNWRQRRRYYWKRIAGLTWIIGPRNTGWYVAVAQSVTQFPWTFLPFECDEFVDAQKCLALNYLEYEVTK